MQLRSLQGPHRASCAHALARHASTAVAACRHAPRARVLRAAASGHNAASQHSTSSSSHGVHQASVLHRASQPRSVAAAAAAAAGGSPAPAQGSNSFPVFLSHAGEQKRDFVSCVHTNLEAWKVRAFLDELSMQPGEPNNMRAIELALQGAVVVVVVLTKDFVCKKHPMWELGLALQRHRADPSASSFVLIPVLQGLSVRDLQDAQSRLYSKQDIWAGRVKPDNDTLQSWAADLRETARIVVKREDQDSGFQGAHATHVAKCAAEVLVRMNRLPRNYASCSNRLLPMFLSRVQLVGREPELRELQDLLKMPEHRRLLLRGGPGDGKTVLAHAAGAALYDAAEMPSGVFSVDLASAGGDLREAVAASIVPKLKLLLDPYGLPATSCNTWLSFEGWLRTLPRNGRLLIVLDNVDELIKQYRSLEAAQVQCAMNFLVQTLIEVSPAVQLLLVARTVAFVMPSTREVLLRPLRMEDAMQLLRRSCPNTLLYPGEARVLVEHCEGNATLLQFVGGILNRRGREIVEGMLQAVRCTKSIREHSVIGGRSKVAYATPDPGPVMLDWWKSLLVFIFKENELQAAAGLAVVADSYHFNQASAVTTHGPLREGIAYKTFEGLIDVSVLQPHLSYQADGSINVGMQYSMQRLHREAASLLLGSVPWYRDSVKQKAAALGLKVQSELELVVDETNALVPSFARVIFDDTCEAAINEQINIEYNVSYLYHSMYAYFHRDNVGLPGMAVFFKAASKEERKHAKLLMEYQNVRGGRVRLASILQTEVDFNHAEKGDALYAMELKLSLEKLNFHKLRELHDIRLPSGLVGKVLKVG